MVEQTQIQTATLNEVALDHPLGRRISVVGGGGKSTLARALAAKLNLPYIELDALHWLPGWQESTAEDLLAKVEAAIATAPDGWVVDGHYWSKIGDFVLSRADMTVWVDLPWRVMWWRVFKRSFQRAWDRQKICGENYESWRITLSTKSLWWWHIRNRSRYMQRQEKLAELLPTGLPVVRLRSAKELNRFYETQRLKVP